MILSELRGIKDVPCTHRNIFQPIKSVSCCLLATTVFTLLLFFPHHRITTTNMDIFMVEAVVCERCHIEPYKLLFMSYCTAVEIPKTCSWNTPPLALHVSVSPVVHITPHQLLLSWAMKGRWLTTYSHTFFAISIVLRTAGHARDRPPTTHDRRLIADIPICCMIGSSS